MWNLIVQIASFLSGVLLGLSYVPQIIQLHKTKNAEGISLKFWYILNGSLLMLFIMALDTFLRTGSASMLVAQSINLVLAVTVMLQVLWIQKKKQ